MLTGFGGIDRPRFHSVSRARSWGATLALGLAVLAAVVSGGAPSATAAESPDGCTLEPYWVGDRLEYRVVCPETDPDADGGEGGSTEPTCELTGLADYCIGASACWANVPSALDPETWPEETRPSPEAIYTYQACSPDPDGTLSGWSWYEPPGPSLGELATIAYGALSAPSFSLGFNPPAWTVVGVDTWFWARTDTPGQIVGSSAAGVVAVGRPSALEVDPGDGSAALTCPWSTAAQELCAYEYGRSSVDGPLTAVGQPAFEARMRLVYDVHFELDGSPLNLPGLPDEFVSPWQSAAVPVAEIQSVVVY